MSVSPDVIAALLTSDSTMGKSFLLGIGVGAEYPCGSVAASEQSEEEGIAKNAQHRWFALATSKFVYDPAPPLPGPYVIPLQIR